MKKIIIAGGTGLIGRSLQTFLSKEGHEVAYLSRGTYLGKKNYYVWNPDRLIMDYLALKDKDVLIQLAGSNIGKGLWTNKKKQEILDSRLRAIQTLYLHLKKNELFIPHIIQASAIGYYGNAAAKILHENSPPGKEGFLAEVCKKWEAEAECLREFTDHLTIVRTGLYLDNKGGVWPKLIQSKAFRLLVYFGDGNQYYSWIHSSDYNRAISFILEKKLQGVFNLTAPNPVSNKNLLLEIDKQSNRKHFMMSIPASFIRILIGEQSQLVLDSNYVLPTRLLENGFEFIYPDLDKAVVELLKHNVEAKITCLNKIRGV